MLKKDQCCAAKIFTETYKKHEVDADAVCDFLKPYLQTLGLFLHFLVYDRKVESSSIHTRLALHYIEQITSLHTDQRISSSPVHRYMVNKLRALLRTSSYLDLKQLSTALNAPHFPHENAIVLGRLGDHTAAINIFIRQLKVNFLTMNNFLKKGNNFKVFFRISMQPKNTVRALTKQMHGIAYCPSVLLWNLKEQP